MRKDFGVGVGLECVSGAKQFLFQRVVIFDDAVVDDGDLAGLVEVRMGIFVRRRAVRGPARVADADGSGDRLGFQQAREALVDFALFLADQQAVAIQHGHARAVVAAIFQPPQSFEQDGRGRFFSDVSNDAAHKFETVKSLNRCSIALLNRFNNSRFNAFKIQSAAPFKLSTITARVNLSGSARSSSAP